MLYKDIESKDVSALILSGPVTIFDMRDLNSFNSGHMDKAVPANDFAIEQIIKKNKKQENILVYCYLGNSSRDLSNLLTKFGFNNVYNLVGGYTAWKKFSNQSVASDSSRFDRLLSNKGFDPLNINDRTAIGNTPLMEAAIDGDIELINEILQRGGDANYSNSDGNLALWFACFSDKLDIVNTLISSTMNLNHQNTNGATCLTYAASSGKIDIVKALVEAGADASIETDDGFNAIDLASTAPILKYLRTWEKSKLTAI